MASKCLTLVAVFEVGKGDKRCSRLCVCVCVWIKPVRLQRSSTWPLLPSMSVWISPCKCVRLLCTLPDQVSALAEPSGPWAPTCKSGRGISCPPAETKLSPREWCKSLHFLLFTPLFFRPLTFSTSSLCPLSHPLIPDGKLPHTAGDLTQGASPAFVYQRSDYPVGCYLSPGDGCGVSGMTAPTPVGDVWSGMERQGLTEVLGSYRTDCDLNSPWIPWGK